MPAFPVSTISRAEYDGQTRQLQLWFRDTSELLTYENVPQTVHEKSLTAGSKGRYFELTIRGRYPSERRIDTHS
ncbi:KTSC domain-containing protein [Acidisoma sp. S159]|uniref:KTSC domain-containing protein n=1 Tax=Acidisoma sp. S159 TaxID=1747225 RepID=UPI00131CFA1F